MQTGLFRRIGVDEIGAAYGLIVERTDWLNGKGIRQWDKPIPEEIIRQRQAAGHFFGYWAADELTAVVCLLEHSVTDWGNTPHGRYLYLATLASSPAHAGQGHGKNCARMACEFARKAGYEKIYLDCVDNAGALPGFYAGLGFRQIDTQTQTNGRRVVLMVKGL